MTAHYQDDPYPADPHGDARSSGFGDTSLSVFVSMLCPGLLWAHKGYTRRAFGLNALFVAVWSTYWLVWMWWKFNPLIPTAILTVGWLLLLFMNAWDAQRAPSRRSFPVGSLYLGSVALFTWFIPLLVVAGFVASNVASVVTVQSASMFPTSLPGDVLFVDRGIYQLSYPRAGDVVLYRVPGERMVRMGRVVGLPGDLVSFQGGELQASRFSVGRGEVEGPFAERFQRATGLLPADVGAKFESLGERVYAVAGTFGSAATARYDQEEWKVGENQIFVLNDNRGHVDDSRAFGPIPIERTLGMPLYVLQSNAEDEGVRRARIGTAMQLPRSIDALRREAAAFASPAPSVNEP